LYPLFDDSTLGFDACNKSEVTVPQQTERATVALPIRSTYEILQFLGQVLRWQEERKERGDNRCLTLESRLRTCDTGEVLFQVNAPVGTPAVATRYDDAWYTLNDRHCKKNYKDQIDPCDYSLQVLAILELLLNANKAAKDIISTPRVQVVP